DDGEDAAIEPKGVPCSLERRAGGVPENSLRIRRIAADICDFSSDDNAGACRRFRPALMRIPTVHDSIRLLQGAVEKTLIAGNLQFWRHDPLRIGEHAVSGNDGVALDAIRPSHPLRPQNKAPGHLPWRHDTLST